MPWFPSFLQAKFIVATLVLNLAVISPRNNFSPFDTIPHGIVVPSVTSCPPSETVRCCGQDPIYCCSLLGSK